MRLSLALLALLCALTVGRQGVARAQNGDGAIFPYLPNGAPADVTRIRYHFYVAENTCTTDFKILFGDSRYWGRDADTNLLEYNLYSYAQLYSDPVYTIWPLQGQAVYGQASLRLCVDDYNKTGLVGAKTADPAQFPRQSYIIDGVTGVPKTDMISQFNLNSVGGMVEIDRGDIIKTRTGWKIANVPLPRNDVFREWDVSATINGLKYKTMMALPNRTAEFVYPNELLTFGSEFFKFAGQFKIYLWGMEYSEVNSNKWRPLNQWELVRYDGDGTDWGFKQTTFNGKNVIEVSSIDGPYVLVDAVIGL